MKFTLSIVLLSAIAMLAASCVSRTVTADAPLGQEGKVVDKKIVWIWQSDFYNP